MSKHGRDLTKGSIPRQLFFFSLPLLLGNMIQAGHSMVNRYWVSNYLGTDSVAAITDTMQVVFVLFAIANGLTLSSGILISQFVGARNWDGVKRVVQNSVTLTLIISVILLVVGQILAVPLLKAIKVPAGAFDLSVGYMRLFMVSFPFVFVAFLTAFMLRGVGDAITPLVFQSIGVVITAILDPFLMLGWWGFPKLGLNGTAVAMLIAQSITVAGFFIYLHKKKHPAAPNWKKLGLDKATSKLLLKIGLPSAVQQLLVALGTSAVMIFINQYGEDAVAGFGVASQIDMMAFFIAMAFSMAVATVAGQNIGAGRFDRVKQTFWWGLVFSGGAVAVISLVAVTTPTHLIGIFVKPAKDPEVFRIGVGYLRIVGSGYLFLAVMFVAAGIINGAGHTLVATLTTLIGLWCIRIPLAGYLSNRMGKVEGIWYAMVISFAVTMAITLIYFFSGKWKKAIVHHGPAPSDVSGEEDIAAGIVP